MKRLLIALAVVASLWPAGAGAQGLSPEWIERTIHATNVAEQTAACLSTQPGIRAPIYSEGYILGAGIFERGEQAMFISPVANDAINPESYAHFHYRDLVLEFIHPVPWEPAITCFIAAADA